MKIRVFNRYRVVKARYEGEDDGNGGAGDGEGDGSGEGGGEGGGTGTRTFTQDQVNKFVAEERRKLTEKNKPLIAELEKLKENVKLTAEERDNLSQRIESLQNQHLTKEELQKKEIQKQKAAWDADLQTHKQEAESWRERYTTGEIHRSLTDSAVSEDAVVPHQIVSILKPMTKLVAVTDKEGNPTGEFVPTVTIQDEKDGKPITLEMTTAEAVKWMKDHRDYQNLFKNSATGGIGGFSGKGGKGISIEQLKDPKVMKQWLKENPGAALPTH